MKNRQDLLLIGTSSNAGKTFLTGFIGKILKDEFKINTCPFKAQNMSNYAVVCEGNKEIAIAQAFQSELMELSPKADMTAILLKPLGDGRSQLVVRGIPRKITSARDYYKEIDTLRPEVDEAFHNLETSSEMLVIEGAGSGFELNLKDRDLANHYMMQQDNVRSILVCNIENGGVFPAILGSYNLMTDAERQKFKGVIINNFKGDVTLFDDGVTIIEKWGIPVLGVIPNIQYSLDSEDSLAIMDSFEEKADRVVQVGVVKYPRASNINDVEPLVHDPNVHVSFITQRTNLNIFDKVILPGSRSVLDDIRWLKKTGIFSDLKETKTEIYGICGGYQMLHESINDPLGTENSIGQADSESGLGLVPGKIEFKEKKILKRDNYIIFDDIKVHGFEMHTGIADQYPLFYISNRIKGSMLHEIFHNDSFRKWWLEINNNIKVKEWYFKTWKKSVQNNVAGRIKDLIDWNRLLKE